MHAVSNSRFEVALSRWGKPPKNSSGIEFPVSLSSDGCTLYFASNREEGFGNAQSFRLYQATRGVVTPSLVTTSVHIVGNGSITTAPFGCSGNGATCSAQNAPNTVVTLWASAPAVWTGSCTGNNGNPSGDGVLV